MEWDGSEAEQMVTHSNKALALTDCQRCVNGGFHPPRSAHYFLNQTKEHEREKAAASTVGKIVQCPWPLKAENEEG
ncbi:hypothetical protein CHUAL_012579 [Chamberlinius hualienensis]